MGLQVDMIALDVDGTLLTDAHVLTPAVRDAVREAASLGAEIVLCTGRGPTNTFPVLEALGLSGTMITHNGAATVNAVTREIIHQYRIRPSQIARYRDYCIRFGYHFDLNTPYDMMIEGMTPEAEAMYGQFKALPTWREATAPLPEDLVKFTIFGSKEEIDKVEAVWNTWADGLQHIRSGDHFIDVQHLESNKGKALKQLALTRGIDRSRIMAIGNYYNDIEMIKFAGIGIAVANSPEEVKSSADHVTQSNEEDGVAIAIRSFAL